MTAVEHNNKLDKTQHAELCCAYGALLLSDAGVAIDAGKLEKVITAAGNKVDKWWPNTFVNALKGQKIENLLSAGASSGSGSAPAAETAAPKTEAAKPEAKKDDKKEKKKEEPKPVEEEEIGFDMFGGDDY